MSGARSFTKSVLKCTFDLSKGKTQLSSFTLQPFCHHPGSTVCILLVLLAVWGGKSQRGHWGRGQWPSLLAVCSQWFPLHLKIKLMLKMLFLIFTNEGKTWSEQCQVRAFWQPERDLIWTTPLNWSSNVRIQDQTWKEAPAAKGHTGARATAQNSFLGSGFKK